MSELMMTDVRSHDDVISRRLLLSLLSAFLLSFADVT